MAYSFADRKSLYHETDTTLQPFASKLEATPLLTPVGNWPLLLSTCEVPSIKKTLVPAIALPNGCAKTIAGIVCDTTYIPRLLGRNISQFPYVDGVG